MYEAFTVQETLDDAVNLRIKDDKQHHREHKKKLVDDILTDLGLSKSRGTRVGNFGDKGVSGGEKRRVCLGVELINNPQILFLDEPTSGLDSFTALLVMSLIKREAR